MLLFSQGLPLCPSAHAAFSPGLALLLYSLPSLHSLSLYMQLHQQPREAPWSSPVPHQLNLRPSYSHPISFNLPTRDAALVAHKHFTHLLSQGLWHGFWVGFTGLPNALQPCKQNTPLHTVIQKWL